LPTNSPLVPDFFTKISVSEVVSCLAAI
jgi:hypothetical protein